MPGNTPCLQLFSVSSCELTGRIPLQRLQVLDELSLLFRAEIQFEVGVVMFHDRVERKKPMVVVEPVTLLVQQVPQWLGAIIGRAVADANLGARVQIPSRFAFRRRLAGRAFRRSLEEGLTLPGCGSSIDFDSGGAFWIAPTTTTPITIALATSSHGHWSKTRSLASVSQNRRRRRSRQEARRARVAVRPKYRLPAQSLSKMRAKSTSHL